jgi:hypothetical protein
VSGRMIIVPTLPEPDYLHSMQAAGTLRASLNVLRGANQGMAFAMSADSDPCAPGTLCYQLLHIGDGPISWVPPKAQMTFATLVVANGSRRVWADAFLEFRASLTGDDYYLAAAHAFGSDDRYNAVVEVLADEPDRMHELVLGATDIPGVEHVDLHVVVPEGTRGMGTSPA